MDRIAVAGVSLAGLRSAEALRRGGFSGELTLIGAEEHFPPYDRPPLSKELLKGEWGPDRGRLRLDGELGATMRLGVRAERLDLSDRLIELDDGSSVGFDGLVIATGATPRRLPFTGSFSSGVHELRTYEDCMSLRSALEAKPRVVIIGGGFIGCEVAADCRELGIEVTVVEALAQPMLRVLGPEIGEWAAGVHRQHGADLRMGVGVTGIEGSAAPELVHLDDGTSIPADVVVVAVGVRPETAWLEDTGLELSDGVVLDQYCRAPGFEGIVGAGDVARWYNPIFERQMRVEHWTNAVEQSASAAAALLRPADELQALATVPYVWSDQYGMKLQFVGIVGEVAAIVDGSLESGRFVALFAESARLVGALGVNSPARVIRYKRMIGAGSSVDEALSPPTSS